MGFAKIENLPNKIADILPKKGAEKMILKALMLLWVIVLVVTFGLRLTKDKSDDIEKKMSAAAVKIPIPFYQGRDEMENYEKLLDFSQHPEPMSEYSLKFQRDPFSKYVERADRAGSQAASRDFTLKAVGNVPLPVVYKGFIELSDKLIGQVSWKDSTRFVEEGGSLNSYKILAVSKEKISAIDECGKEWDFFMNKPVMGDKLNAVLYDSVLKKTYTVEVASVIDDYKVIDIQSDCVILLLKGSEIKLTK